MKKLFLCVGAAKTGTTWLYRNIRANPDLRFTPEKEINFFFSLHGRFDRLTQEARDKKLEAFRKRMEVPGKDPVRMQERLAWYERFVQGPIDDNWYRGLFDGMPEDQWACDFSPSTSLITEEGWEKVSGFAPEIKIVYIMREPEERLWSHAKFHAAFINQLDHFKTMQVGDITKFIRKFQLTEDGDYGSHLQRMLKYIPRESVLLLEYSEIANAPEATLRKVEAHLGLGKTPGRGSLDERVNVSEKMPMPLDFARDFHEQFHREMQLLASQDVGFARPWVKMHTAGAVGRRRFFQRVKAKLGLK